MSVLYSITPGHELVSELSEFLSINGKILTLSKLQLNLFAHDRYVVKIVRHDITVWPYAEGRYKEFWRENRCCRQRKARK